MKEITKLPNGNIRVRTINNEPSLTQQHFKEQCDVNNIIRKYQQTGNLTHLARQQGVYSDLSKQKDYFEAMNTVIKAQTAFDSLPSYIRKRFGNDPSQLLQFIEDPKNQDEGIKLGLFNPKNPQTQQNQTNPNEQKSTNPQTPPQKS